MENCYHCGDEIVTKIEDEGKLFCCQGCVSVFHIIAGAGLGDYYHKELNPGVKNKRNVYLDYLDDLEVANKLLVFKDNERSVVRFILPAIHCASCVWLLERLALLSTNIISSEIDFLSKRITIHFKHNEISLKEVAELLLSIGYEPQLDNKKKARKNTSLIIRIGVAGFCFGNIMLLSFPEYLGEETGAIWQKFFSFLNIALAIPIFTYCSVPFYRGLFTASKAKKVSVDLLIVVGIITLLIRSLYEILYLNQGGYLDSLAGLLFFLLIGKWFQAKVFSELSFEKDNASYLPMAVLKYDEDDFIITSLSKIKKGDILRLRNGEVVPYKCVVKSESGIVENSFITGEELPLQVKKGDILFSGSQVNGAYIEVVVSDIEGANLSSLWREQKRKDTANELISNQLITGFTIFVLLVSLGSFIYWSFTSYESAFLSATSVLIVACPCALALSAPTVYGIILRKFSKSGLYAKGADVIKNIAQINRIVFDKTGTITGKSIKLKYVGSTLTSGQKQCIASILNHSTHPLAKELLKTIHGDLHVDFFKETLGEGVEGVVEGVLYKIGSSAFVNVTNPSVTSIHIMANGQNLGYYQIGLTIRAGIYDLMQKLKSKFEIYLLSGDPNLNKADYADLINEANIVKNASPMEKSAFIEACNNKAATLMIGDGINDSLAFNKAKVGLAVVEETGAFFPSCDGIIEAEKITDLNGFINYAKYSKIVLWSCFAFSLSYNLVGLYFAVNLLLTPLFAAILMPLSSISVVGLAVILLNVKKVASA